MQIIVHSDNKNFVDYFRTTPQNQEQENPEVLQETPWIPNRDDLCKMSDTPSCR